MYKTIYIPTFGRSYTRNSKQYGLTREKIKLGLEGPTDIEGPVDYVVVSSQRK